MTTAGLVLRRGINGRGCLSRGTLVQPGSLCRECQAAKRERHTSPKDAA